MISTYLYRNWRHLLQKKQTHTEADTLTLADRQADTHTHRGKRTDRQTDRQADTQIDRQTDR